MLDVADCTVGGGGGGDGRSSGTCRAVRHGVWGLVVAGVGCGGVCFGELLAEEVAVRIVEVVSRRTQTCKLLAFGAGPEGAPE